MARIFDTHCHLNHAQFDADRAEVLSRAHEAGVREMVLIGWDLESSRRAAALADPAAGLYAAVGIHPHDARQWSAAASAELRSLLQSPGVVALGEIGLDFYRDLSPRDTQHVAFQGQLELAVELDLPIVVHTRESVGQALDVLEPFCRAGLSGVMHCWSGTAGEAHRAVGLSLRLGIGGVVTYKNVGELEQVVRQTPIECLVLETDAPYLPPTPYRGRRNEPAYLTRTAARVAELKGLEPAAAAAGTRAAARALFRLDA